MPYVERGTRPTLAGLVMAMALVGCAAGQDRPDTPAWRLLRASEAEQIAAVNSTLDRGFPPDNDIGLLMVNKSPLVLPLVEKKIEQVLKSASPRECFTDETVDPNRFVVVASWGMANTGSEQALVEVAKLIKLDEKRFGQLVEVTLISSEAYSTSHNPFVVAYSGLAIADPVVQKLILSWAEKNLTVDPEERARAEEATRGYGSSLVGGSFGPPTPSPARKMKHLWGEAMVKRYGGAPTDAQWASDPIASGLSRPLADSVHSEIPELIGSAQALVEISKIIQPTGIGQITPRRGKTPSSSRMSDLPLEILQPNISSSHGPRST